METFKWAGIKKIVTDIEKVGKLTSSLKSILGYKIVATIGTWDLLHIGHLRYLNRAKQYGDLLIVGADTDRAVKLYKGDLRPIIPQEERMEMLSYQSCVDIITLVDDIDEKGNWQYELIKIVRPDIFIAVEDSYPTEQQEEIKKFCEKSQRNHAEIELVAVTKYADAEQVYEAICYGIKIIGENRIQEAVEKFEKIKPV